MANQNNPSSGTATERVIAPATVPPVSQAPLMPRQKQLERQGGVSAGYSIRYPEIRGGICEHCGVLDGNYPSEYQYKLCPHYRGMQMRCVYCPDDKNPDDIINHSVLRVAEHPNNPDTLVVWCDSYECSKKHLERFKINS